MTFTPLASLTPAVLGGDPAFPEGLPITQVTVPDREALLRRLDTIIDSGRLTNGATVRALEDATAERLGVPHVVGVASCTAGLMLTLRALELSGPVVLPSFTFAATAHAVAWAGGTPVFADMTPTSLTLDPDDAARALPGADAVIGTHVYGTPCDVEALEALAADHGVPLIFDAAHALGSLRRGRPIGGFGSAEVFSLSPTKVVVAGEGGLVATSDAALADAVRIGRDYGNPGDYDCRFVGLNARMSELHAAVGLASLGALDARLSHRNDLAARFVAAIAGLPGLRVPEVAAGDRSTYKDLTVVLDPADFGLDAATLQVALRADGIDTRRYFYPPVHQQQAYAQLLPGRALPVTEAISPQVLTLPLWSHMEAAVIDRVADVVTALHTHAHRVRDTLAGHV
ncbi:MAG: DegT/DnrJ/EryC1/StrS family aminotransferase [Jiangellaceae bacterium]